MDFTHEVESACERAFSVLKTRRLKFRPMRRQRPVDYKKGFTIARTNLKTKLITIDIFTPKKREPKKISSILRSLAHEIAHHQKKPFRARFRGSIITRQHYPVFYKQVNKNIEKLKKDLLLGNYFN